MSALPRAATEESASLTTGSVQPTPQNIPSLGGLRAISIILVIAGHALGSAEGRSFGFRFLFLHAGLGVRIFFVISGFLITTLLLKERAAVGRISLRLFYARRALRILPAFYAFVLCVIVLERLGLLSLPPHNLIYVFTYTVNFASDRGWWTGHLWSLSVEEQFYMLWPLAIRFFAMRTCAALALLAVFAGLLIRMIFAITGLQLIDPSLRYAFPFVSGAIGMGCLLAIGGHRFKRAIVSRPWLSGWPTLAAILSVILLDTPDLGSLNRPIAIAGDLVLTFVIGRFVYLPEGIAGRLLNSRVLGFIGTLSYSLYLWQQLFFHQYADSWVCRFPFNLVATVAAACASYFLLERPLLNLRRRFRTQSREALRTEPGADALMVPMTVR